MRALYFPDETIRPKAIFSYVEARMNSKAAQLTENGTEIVRLFARLALGASFLSAVADRFGLWGPYGAKNVAWGNFARFVEYTGAVTSLFPSSLTVSFAWAATVAETLFGILLIAGFPHQLMGNKGGRHVRTLGASRQSCQRLSYALCHCRFRLPTRTSAWLAPELV